MRSVDLALYADELAARAASLAAQLERARGRLPQAPIEREARRALDSGSVEMLVSLRVVREADPGAVRGEIRRLAEVLASFEELQAWVERRIREADEAAQGIKATSSPPSSS
jgi:hypothetical protein